MRRHRLEVVRPVEPGRPVHRPAGRLDQGDVLRLGHVPRALEHDVLEEMGEAGLARDLVLGADVVPDVHRDDRGEVILGHDQAQAVRKALVGERHGRNGHPGELLQNSGVAELYGRWRPGTQAPPARRPMMPRNRIARDSPLRRPSVGGPPCTIA